MDKTLIEGWIHDLLSGEYKQGRNALRHAVIEPNSHFDGSPETWCCLGVLGNRLVAMGLAKWEKREGAEWYLMDATATSEQRYSERLANTGYIPDELADKVGLTHHRQRQLSKYNDAGQTFEFISRLIKTMEV